MASERDFELLDDYLANRLSGDEKVAFEQRMEGDPELKRELTVQQNIVEGIKRARIADLKGILQNTPIPAPSFSDTLFAKVGAVAVVAGLIVAGVWFFTKDKHEEVKQEQAPVAEKAPENVQPEIVEEPKVETTETKETPAQVETTPSKNQTKVTPAKAKDSAKASEAVKPEEKTLFDPSQELEATATPTATEAPTADQLKNAVSRNSVNSSVNPRYAEGSRKHNFHYEFKSGDLLLYGPEFKNPGTYLILEFFLGGKDTTVYLYHDAKYYLLDRNTTEPVKLEAIKDKTQIAILDEKRKAK
jgi:hypothetical protein